MCVAIMGRVTAVDGRNAVIDCRGAKIRARRDLVDIAVGELVMVHAGYIMQRVTEEDAALAEELLQHSLPDEH